MSGRPERKTQEERGKVTTQSRITAAQASSGTRRRNTTPDFRSRTPVPEIRVEHPFPETRSRNTLGESRKVTTHTRATAAQTTSGTRRRNTTPEIRSGKPLPEIRLENPFQETGSRNLFPESSRVRRSFPEWDTSPTAKETRSRNTFPGNRSRNPAKETRSRKAKNTASTDRPSPSPVVLDSFSVLIKPEREDYNSDLKAGSCTSSGRRFSLKVQLGEGEKMESERASATTTRDVVLHYLSHSLMRHGYPDVVEYLVIKSGDRLETTPTKEVFRIAAEEFESSHAGARYLTRTTDGFNPGSKDSGTDFMILLNNEFNCGCSGPDWCQVVRAISLTVRVCLKSARSEKADLIWSLLNWFFSYMSESVEGWIQRAGGWDGFAQHRNERMTGSCRLPTQPADDVMIGSATLVGTAILAQLAQLQTKNASETVSQ